MFIKKKNVEAIKEHLLIYGDLTGVCAKCNHSPIKLDQTTCPSCSTEFKSIAFHHIKSHFPKLQKLVEARLHIEFIDYDDFNKACGALKAKQFLQ